MTKTFLAALLALTGLSSFAQQPSITGVDRTSGANHSIVTIAGNGFGNNAAQLAVFFGAAKIKNTDILSVSDQILEVRVPATATYDKISVINTTSKLAAYSPAGFLYSFGGDHGFDATKLDGQADFPARNGLYDLCMCDFDGDGRTDIATANSNSGFITLLANATPAPGISNVAFNDLTAATPQPNTKTLHTTCGDLNGDGKPDIAFTEEGVIANRVFVYQNNSTGTGNFQFTIQQTITLTSTVVKQLKIADLDRDGRPEIVITNQSLNNVKILANQTTGANIAMSNTPISVDVGGSTTDALSIDDLNGDGLPEILVAPFLTATNYVHILPNKSTPGSISFDNIISLDAPNAIANIKSGDLDHDGKPDIAITMPSNNQVGIYLNQGSGTNFSFASPALTFIAGLPFGLDFGDLDGDSKTDIVVGTLTATSLTFLNNESTPGNLSFQKSTKPATYITRHVKIGDLDGDARPDIAFVSADKSGVPASQVSVFINKVCVKPDVTPKGPHNICAGFPLKLETGDIPGTTYEWKRDATTLTAGADAFFNLTVTSVTGNYTVTATSPGCSNVSTPVSITVGAASTSTATIDDDSPICIGSPLQLRVQNGAGGETYNWSGPQSYTGSSAPVTVTTSFQQANAGRYFLDVLVGGCVAKKVSTVIDAIPAPIFKVNNGSASIICAPATQTLSVDPPAITAYTYQWFKNSGSISTGPTYSANTSGVYYFEATPVNPGCAMIKSNDVTITFATPPSVAFDLPPSPNCVGENIIFANQSVTDPLATPSYLWEITNGSPASSTDISASTKYLTAGTFGVKLTVSYNNSTTCTVVSAPKTITIQPAPPVTITSAGNLSSFCPGESLELKVTGAFTAYKWNTNETSAAIVVSTPGTYDVDVTTTNGCVINAFKQVTQFDAPRVTITALPEVVPEGTTSQLAASGLNNYTWTPAETLSNASIANPVASPQELLTVYEVSGTDSHGCKGSATIEIRVRQGSIYSKIVPSKFFSPNQDEVGEYWLIDRIEEFSECQVTIYDDKGVKVHAAKPYHNDWDGTFKGARLPDGVYYFVIKCDGEQNSPKTGSITILR